MLIEALSPLTIRVQEGEMTLDPGKAVDLPAESAKKLIQMAHGKVRAVPNWLTEWRAVCDLTYGITAEDHRIPAILDTIGQCDRAFAEGDYQAFLLAREGVKRVCQKGTVHE